MPSTQPKMFHSKHAQHNTQHYRYISIRDVKLGEQDAKQIADKRQINLILICPAGYSLGFNPQNNTWLQPIPLPHNYSKCNYIVELIEMREFR